MPALTVQTLEGNSIEIEIDDNEWIQYLNRTKFMTLSNVGSAAEIEAQNSIPSVTPSGNFPPEPTLIHPNFQEHGDSFEYIVITISRALGVSDYMIEGSPNMSTSIEESNQVEHVYRQIELIAGQEINSQVQSVMDEIAGILNRHRMAVVESRQPHMWQDRIEGAITSLESNLGNGPEVS